MKFKLDPKSPSHLSSENGAVGSLANRGYWRVAIYVDGKKRNVQAHNIVWELANGPIPAGKTVDHINRDRTDNRPENLRLLDLVGQLKNRSAWSSSGLKYVYKRGTKFSGEFKDPVTKKMRYAGRYETPAKAHLEALALKLELHWID